MEKRLKEQRGFEKEHRAYENEDRRYGKEHRGYKNELVLFLTGFWLQRGTEVTKTNKTRYEKDHESTLHHASILPSIHSSIHASVHPLLHLPLPFMNPSVNPSIDPPLHPSIHSSILLSAYCCGRSLHSLHSLLTCIRRGSRVIGQVQQQWSPHSPSQQEQMHMHVREEKVNNPTNWRR